MSGGVGSGGRVPGYAEDIATRGRVTERYYFGEGGISVSLIRISLATSLAATSSAYTFPINPSRMDTLEDLYQVQVNVLHGSPAWQKACYDGRPRIMYWSGFSQDQSMTSTAASIFENMLVWLRARRGMVKYINFGNLTNINRNWPSLGSWNKCRIIDVQSEIKEGGAIKYNEVKLIFQPEK